MKLRDLKAELQNEDVFNHEGPDFLVANVKNEMKLKEIFSKARLVLNCVGPYRFFGEPVVRAAIEAKCDYMDICGEPKFIEEMYLKYDDTAKAAQVLVIHACAFDSVPADLGFLFTMRNYAPNCCHHIESFLTVHCGSSGLGGHYTTYESAVHGIGDKSSLQKLRSEIQQKYHLPKIINIGDKLKRYDGLFYHSASKKYAFPFMGADAAVVRSTQRNLSVLIQETTWPQYAAYFTLGSLYNSVRFLFYGSIFQFLCNFSFGRSVLLKYPKLFTNGVFSHEGPSQDQLEGTSFDMTFYSRGTEAPPEGSTAGRTTKNVVTRVTGPEPGYVATPAILVALAKLVLSYRIGPEDALQESNRTSATVASRGDSFSTSASALPRGGVLTPGSAFYNCQEVYNKLREVGIDFQLLDVLAHTGGNSDARLSRRR